MNARKFVSSIRKRGLGCEIEISHPFPFFKFFSYTIKRKYICNNYGCFKKNGDIITDSNILNMLLLAYKRFKKTDV